MNKPFTPEAFLNEHGAEEIHRPKAAAQPLRHGSGPSISDRFNTGRRPLPPLRWPSEFDDIQPPEELVEGVLIADSLSLIYGAPKCGKTFVMLDMALHIAHGLVWNGRKVKRGLVIYAAGEGPTGVMFRVKAWHQYHGLRMADADFALLPACPDLFHDDGHTDDFICAIKGAEQVRGEKAVLTIIDTVHRALAGGNDSASEDIGKLVTNAEWVRAEANAHVALIHHSGKDRDRGSRGSNSLPAAVSTIIEVVKDETTGARVTKVEDQRDLPDGDAFPFRLEPVDLGTWGDRQIGSLVVVEADGTDPLPSDARRKKVATLKDQAALLLRHIETALASGMGKTVSPKPGDPPVVALDRRTILRGLLVQKGWFSEAQLSDPLLGAKAVSRAGLTFERNQLSALERRGILGLSQEWVWLV